MAEFEVPAGLAAREPDGLLVSPLNAALSREERRIAPALFRSLLAGQLLFGLGEKDAGTLARAVIRALAAEPALEVEAVGVACAVTGKAIRKVDRPAILAAAVRLGGHRLVDAVRLEDR